MNIITGNAQLCRFIPNAFAPVGGETSLYDKLEPHIRRAELWFSQRVIPLEDLYSDANGEVPVYPQLPDDLVPSVIATEAYRTAVDSLNLVLTANGFGIVSNDHTAPASRERTDHLKEELLFARDNAIARLISLLDSGCDWEQSAAFARFHETLHPYGTRLLPFQRFEDWESEQGLYRLLEDSLADRYVSRPLYNLMRSRFEAADTLTGHDRMCLRSVRRMLSVIERNIIAGQEQDRQLRAVVGYIRTAREEDGETPARVFDLWRTSPVAALWQDHGYRNDKEKGGYWL